MNKQRYSRGELIESIDELVQCNLIWFESSGFHKIYHYGWFTSWQLQMANKYIQGKLLYRVVRIEELNEKERTGSMNISVVKQDLFTVPQGYYLAHCISGDYALGAGIAKQFDERYNMRFKLFRNYPIPDGEKTANVGKALLVDNVFNLVTKGRYFEKPTYETLKSALKDMRRDIIAYGIKKLAMPKIGCGLDRLDWDKVYHLIEEVFGMMDIEILICQL